MSLLFGSAFVLWLVSLFLKGETQVKVHDWAVRALVAATVVAAVAFFGEMEWGGEFPWWDY